METLVNEIGTVTHLVLCSTTQEQYQALGELEKILPEIEPGKIETIEPRVMYCLPRVNLKLHESDWNKLDLYIKKVTPPTIG